MNSKIELFNYQKYTVDKAVEYFDKREVPYPKFNIFFEMGLGKTLTSIEIINRIKPKTVLIVCPKSLIDMWKYNIYKYCDISYAFISEIEYLNNYDYNKIIIVNYEQLLKLDKRIFPDLCIFDEVHKLKNCKSKIHNRIVKNILPNKTLCLTGTPITRNLMDLFGILTCIVPQEFEGLSATMFHYKYVVNGGIKSYNELISHIKPYTMFVNLRDAEFDMPSTEDIIIPCKLSGKGMLGLQEIYTSPDNSLTKIVKAHQVTSQFSDKRSNCCELIEDLVRDNHKIVVFCKFDEEFEFFMQQYATICVGINGKTKDREQQVQEFQNNPQIRIFIGNLQTAGIGITLTAAHHCIFYSDTYSWADMEQSKARIYRIGQDKPCKYYHLICKDTIDELIYQNILDKTNLIETFEKYMSEGCNEKMEK